MPHSQAGLRTTQVTRLGRSKNARVSWKVENEYEVDCYIL